jgi:hypothetical protein
MKMKSTASRPFKYAGLLVQPSAEFSVKSARDAKLLAIMRRAVVVAEVPQPVVVIDKPAKRAYKRRDMVAEIATTAEPATEPSIVEQATDPAGAEQDIADA